MLPCQEHFAKEDGCSILAFPVSRYPFDSVKKGSGFYAGNETGVNNDLSFSFLSLLGQSKHLLQTKLQSIFGSLSFTVFLKLSAK